MKTIEELRDDLLRTLKVEEKEPELRSKYVDGVLDMYNAIINDREVTLV